MVVYKVNDMENDIQQFEYNMYMGNNGILHSKCKDSSDILGNICRGMIYIYNSICMDYHDILGNICMGMYDI